MLTVLLPLLATNVGPPTADADEARLAPVVVSATRSERDPFEVAASIDVIVIDTTATPALGIHSSEALASIAGVVARNRHNHAQDEQISIRGYGARAGFGVRGVRLYVDGIPATMPDGAGQVSHFHLDSAERIEVLRGPFSALYGNASGGVISVFSAPGEGAAQWRSHAAAGSHGTARLGVNVRGELDAPLSYNVGVSHFHSDGYREHSQARRSTGNARLDWQIGDGQRLRLLVNAMDLPEAKDPLGLDRAAFETNPRQVVAVARQFDTRKSVRQQQAGLVYEHDLGERQQLQWLLYGGQRRVEQFLAIPAAAQGGPLHAGGVIDLQGDYRGSDLRWRLDASLAGRPLEVILGLALDENDQRRRGYENFVGDQLGVRGRLRRDEDNRARSSDQYAQAEWAFAEDWSLQLGLRRSSVRFHVDDRYITASNPDDSGSARHSATSPVVGLLFRWSPALRLYATWGRGFETPTFAELGYRPDGGAGLNLDLRPARSRHGELGFKLRSGRALDLHGAVFRSDTDDEIAVASSSGGRSTFQNIAASRRQGLELSAAMPLPGEQGRLQASWTWLDAHFRTPFLACSRGCSAPDTPVPSGTPIPGVPRSQWHLESRWGGTVGWQGGIGARHIASVPVNDLDSERADAHTLLIADVGHGWPLASGELRVFARIDNLLDRNHAASVIVNEGNGRFYEPGPGRSLLLGLQWRSR